MVKLTRVCKENRTWSLARSISLPAIPARIQAPVTSIAS